MNDPSDYSRPWAIWLTAIVSVIVVCIQIIPDVIKLVREQEPTATGPTVAEESTPDSTAPGENTSDIDKPTHTETPDGIFRSVDEPEESLDPPLVGENPTVIEQQPSQEELLKARAMDKVRNMDNGAQIALHSHKDDYRVIGIQKEDGFHAFSRSILLELIEQNGDQGFESDTHSIAFIVEENWKTGERVVSEVEKQLLARKLARAVDTEKYTLSYSNPDVIW
ncbi:MAG: hypothetical protein AAFQ74_16000 [Cyanobacteria bacterium J06623_4]